MRPIVATLALLLSGVSCGDNPAPTAADICQTVALPLSGDPAGPTVTDVALEIQPVGVVVLATATDPEGTDNMLQVLQTIGVFSDAVCLDAPIVVRDDLACSGCEESFGTGVPATNQTLYDEIAAAQTWPVTLDFSDIDGHQTQGRVLARVIH
jgi:hypothetical protein